MIFTFIIYVIILPFVTFMKYISFFYIILLYFILYFINDATAVERKHRRWKHFLSSEIAWHMC